MEVAGILVGLAGLAVSVLVLRVTKRQPLAEGELRFADLAGATDKELLEVRQDGGVERLEAALVRWREATSRLEPRLGADPIRRVDSVTLFIESAQRLRLYEDGGRWIEACGWACQKHPRCGISRARGEKPIPPLFPLEDELQQLLSLGAVAWHRIGRAAQVVHRQRAAGHQR